MPTRRPARVAGRIATFAAALVTLCALASVFLYVGTRSAGTTYYSRGSLPPELTTNWSSTRDGLGASPLDFTSGDTFVIQNTHNMSTLLSWSVSGANSKVQIEDGGTLTANNAVTLSAATTFQIDDGGTYVQNASVAMGSTILQGTEAFGAASNFVIHAAPTGTSRPSSPGYGNLTIDITAGTTNVNWGGDISAVQGNFTIQSTGANAAVEHTLTGGSNLTISVGGNLNISGGTLVLSDGAGVPTVNLGGGYDQTGGTLTSTGSAVGSINFTGGTNFVNFVKTAGTLDDAKIDWSIAGGKTVEFDDAFTNAASRTFNVDPGGMLLAADAITNDGTLNVNGEFRLTDGGGGTGTNFTYGADGTLGFASSVSYAVNGDAYWPAANGPANVTVLGLGITMNVARSVGGLFDYYAGVANAGNLTLNGTSQASSGGFIDSGSPNYGPASTLKYNAGLTYNRNNEWLPDATSGAGYPFNVKLSNGTTLNLPNGSNNSAFQLGGTLTIDTGSTLDLGAMTKALTLTNAATDNGTLALGSGKVLTGANTLSVGAAGAVTRTTGYVIGTLQKSFPGAGGFAFEVGTANGYSPVNVDVTAGTFPASLAVSATQGKHPQIPGTNALARYWTLSGSGFTADLTFNYLDGDVVGDENNYQVFKYDGTFTAPADQSVSAPDNAAIVGGVSSFSDWTAAEASSVFPAPLSGTKTVCASGCDYVNLTGASGLFAAINASTVEGDIVARIAGDLVEGGENALNQWTETGGSGYTLTIEPADGTTKTISGDVAAGMIRLNGADRVTIDGRFNDSGRFLTFRNTSPGGATIKLSNDASNDTVRSSVIEGAAVDPNPFFNPTVGVITVGTGATTGNDDDTFTDNRIRDLSTAAGVPTFLFISTGTSASVSNSDGTLSNNDLFNFRVSAVNISAFGDGSDSWAVTGNTVYQTAASTNDVYGIWFGAAGTNAVTGNTVHDLSGSDSSLIVQGINLDPASGTTDVSRNRIYSLTHTENQTELTGIAALPGGTATVNVFNNQVSIVPSNTKSQYIYGISEQGGAGTTTVNLFYNTVLVGGTASGGLPTRACAKKNSGDGASTWRDNICFNGRTGGGANHFAAANESTAGSFSSDYNIFVGTGTTASDFFDYGTADDGTPVSFATWKSSTGGDSHSLASNPGGDYTVANMFTSATDLHLNTSGTNPASNKGTPLDSVTKDFDDETRDPSIPDIGADEVAGASSLQFSQAAYGVGEGAGVATITVTRTGSSVGAVSVTYSTGNGTAAAGSDYTAASGKLEWEAGDLEDKTFDVTVSDDAVYEGDEIFNVSLGTTGGGAVLGTPNTAAVTINDNDSAPALSVADVTKAEGDSGQTAFEFTVTKTGATALDATVDYATQDCVTNPATGGASCGAGVDYVTTSGPLTFAPGDTEKKVTVQVCGDTDVEPDEDFFLNLSNAGGATLDDQQAEGVIQNDDAAAPSPIVVDSTADTTANDGFCTLREAITNANNNDQSGSTDCGAGVGADTINFDIPGAGPHVIQLTTALPALSESVDILNTSGESITVRGEGAADSYPIFIINSGQTVNISGLTVSNGRNFTGGGIQNAGTLTMTDCTVSGNDGSGGGGLNNKGTLNLINCTVSGNTAGGGGGFLNDSGGTATVTNSTISGNSSIGDGGGIYNIGALTLTGATVTDNFADSDGNGSGEGGGISVHGGTPLLRSTIVAGNFNEDGATDAADDINTGSVDAASSYNLIGAGGAGGLTNGTNGNQVGVADPGLLPLADNGGPTQTHALSGGSPAIDKGKAFGSTNDQRGLTRPVDLDDAFYPNATDGDGTDIGAFELQLNPDRPSVVSIVRASADPTTENTVVDFTVTFSEAVTGVDSNDFSVNAPGGTGAVVTNVAGSGTTYTVSVNTGTGASSVRLDVSDNDSIKDADNNPLGGTGAGNGNFNTGESYTILPAFSISDVTKAEGNAGTTAFTFNVTKTGAGAASVDFATQDDTAEAGSDYASNSGKLDFASGDTTKQVTVQVNGDTTPETDETFLVVLSNPSGASVTKDTGTGTISNDEESVSAGQFIISEFRLRGPGEAPIPEDRPVGEAAAKNSPAAKTSPQARAAASRCHGASAAVTSSKKTLRAPVQTSVPASEPDTSPEANDEFIELYNNTDSPLLVTTTDGSQGWAVAASDGVVRFIVPNGTVIPPRAHFLSLNLLGYSLYGYPAGDGSFQPPFAIGDYVIRGDGTDCFGYEVDIPDNAGIALFRTSDPAKFNTDTRLDAVGSTAEANTLYKEGAGYPALAPEDIAKNLEHSFFRSLCSYNGAGCSTPGVPKDTNDNAADFLFVDTEGTPTAAGQRLGAPGPENLASPVQRNGKLPLVLLDRTVPNTAPPNRLRTFGEDAANNSTFGTLSIRRRLTNNTGADVTALRFRIVELTTTPAPAGTADLRARDSDDIIVTGVADEETCSSTGSGGAPCDVDVYGTTLEQPPAQEKGGGLNSSLGVGVISLDYPLAPGESINVHFLLGIQQTGAFRILVNVEAVTDECSCPSKPARASRRAARR